MPDGRSPQTEKQAHIVSIYYSIFSRLSKDNLKFRMRMKIVILIAKGKRDKKRGLSQFFVYLWRAIKNETLVKNGIRARKTLRRGEGATMAGKCPCCMCNNARVDDKLTEDDNLSYLAVEESVRPFRILFASGCGEPFRLLVQFLIDGQWSAAAVYYPRYCPNCGRELLEYGPGA